MIENAAESPPELVRVGADRMPAALAMRERDYAVDIRRQLLAGKARRDQLGRVGCAIAAATTAM